MQEDKWVTLCRRTEDPKLLSVPLELLHSREKADAHISDFLMEQHEPSEG